MLNKIDLFGKLKFDSRKIGEYFETIIIFLNISNSYTIIPYLIFFQYYRAYNSVIIGVINLLYILFKFKNKFLLPSPKKDILLYLFIFINLTNILVGLVTDTFALGTIPFIFTNFTFYFLLVNLYSVYSSRYDYKTSIKLILRGYLLLCMLNILIVFTLFALINIFDFYPLINEVNDTMDLFKGNVEKGFGNYFFPLNLGIIFNTNDIRIPILQNYGLICGIFHEPHTMTFVTTPSFFYFIYSAKRNYVKLVMLLFFVLYILLASSTTNIIAVGICLLIFSLIKVGKYFFYILAILAFVFFLIPMVDESFFMFLNMKLTSRSLDYSESTIKFAFAPKTIIGTNFYDLSYWDSNHHNYDVGLMNFIINISFLVILYFKLIKANISKYPFVNLVALMLTYIFLHSAKVAMVSYSLSIIVFSLFVLELIRFNSNGK